MSHEKLMDRARDELFSHINRCGVLQASPEDQKTWMSETIDYLAERYPDLGDLHLDQLHNIGLRFCAPAIGHGNATASSSQPATEAEAEVEATEQFEEGQVEEEEVTADATAA